MIGYRIKGVLFHRVFNNTSVENCRRLGINARVYLEDALTRLTAMKARESSSFTAEKWLAARTGKAARPTA